MAEEHSTLEVIPEEQIRTDVSPENMVSLEQAFDAAQEKAGDEDPDALIEASKENTRNRHKDGKFKGKEEKPVEPEARADEDADPDVDKIEEPKGLHPKKRQEWKALQTTAKERGKAIKERDSRIAELERIAEENKKAAPLNDEERKELARLQDYEFINDPAKSKRITEGFDKKMDQANDGIYPMLLALGLPETEEAAKKLEKDGVVPLSLEAVKRDGGIKSQPYAWWEANVLNNQAIDGRTRAKIGNLVNQYFDTADERAAALEKAPKDKEAWQAEQERMGKEQNQKYIAQLSEEAGKVQKSLGEWAMEVQIPPNASPEQKAKLEAQNKTFKEKYYPAFLARLDAPTAEAHVKNAMGVDSPVALYWQQQTADAVKRAETAEKRAKEAEERYAGVKQSGKISAARTPVAAAKAPSFMKESPEDAWDKAQAAGR